VLYLRAQSAPTMATMERRSFAVEDGDQAQSSTAHWLRQAGWGKKASSTAPGQASDTRTTGGQTIGPDPWGFAEKAFRGEEKSRLEVRGRWNTDDDKVRAASSPLSLEGQHGGARLRGIVFPVQPESCPQCQKICFYLL
jgi:hypothetical protein